jgi:hypothetical protein
LDAVRAPPPPPSLHTQSSRREALGARLSPFKCSLTRRRLASFFFFFLLWFALLRHMNIHFAHRCNK